MLVNLSGTLRSLDRATRAKSSGTGPTITNETTETGSYRSRPAGRPERRVVNQPGRQCEPKCGGVWRRARRQPVDLTHYSQHVHESTDPPVARPSPEHVLP
jgi:hypothetical protein